MTAFPNVDGTLAMEVAGTLAMEVAELPGEFGPVSLSERVVQRIWLRQDFHREDLKTQSGRRLVIRRPGQWNLQEGPDFRDALLEIDGERVDGDVEIHFYPGDWFDHGHESDANFDRVVLHVVVFDDGSRPAYTALGAQPETLALLPLLDRDLESHAMEDALLAMERRDHLDLVQYYLSLSVTARLADLRDLAFDRWRQKRRYAQMRIERLGWRLALHQAVLEALGFRRNRAPMIALAERFPPDVMATMTPDSLFEFAQGRWKLAGLRPANHPRRRFEQYLTLLNGKPDWPQSLLKWTALTAEADPDERTTLVRRTARFSALRDELAGEVLCSALSGPRLDTLVVDALLPMLSVETGRDLFGLWHHWMVGDAPGALNQFLREAGVCGPRQPRCNGLLQGALQRFFTQGL
ncbi:DUF2851 family protein [Cerasicoccus fimbriatus]|uniref:DUF2851 family protein n=1 Tax=Cerasicoccus fimbriatus TaxID=3014554 RepID=UPI0022B3AB9C|nr:DUF2851 family protein [Cerasicoccus sp. TK19100]